MPNPKTNRCLLSDHLEDLTSCFGAGTITKARLWWDNYLETSIGHHRVQYKPAIKKEFPDIYLELAKIDIPVNFNLLFHSLVYQCLYLCKVCRHPVKGFVDGNPKLDPRLYCSHLCASRCGDNKSRIRQSISSTWSKKAKKNPELFRKHISYPMKWKPTKTMDGRTLLLQGYEPIALERLEHLGYRVWRPLTIIKYKDGSGNTRSYFPDLAVRKGRDKRLIEVKSDYTIKRAKEKLLAAYRWGIDNKVKFEVWLYLGKDKDLHRLTSPDQWESFL